jgi:hypothetical protein
MELIRTGCPPTYSEVTDVLGSYSLYYPLHGKLDPGRGGGRFQCTTLPQVVLAGTCFIGVLYYYHRPIVLYYPLLGAILRLGRWPPPLGPPTDLMPGHLSPECGLTTLNDTHLRDGQSR